MGRKSRYFSFSYRESYKGEYVIRELVDMHFM